MPICCIHTHKIISTLSSLHLWQDYRQLLCYISKLFKIYLMHKNKDFGILLFLRLLIRKYRKTSQIWKHSPSIVLMGGVVVRPCG